MRNRTWLVKTKALPTEPQLASVLIRLMMTINDLSLVQTSIDDWTGTEDARRQAGS